MKRYLQLMGVLMILQLIVSAIVLWPNATNETTPNVLYEANAELIQMIEVSDMANNVISLEKTAEKSWLVKHNGIAHDADTSRVEQMLAVLTSPIKSWPVAKTENARARFAVAEDDYQWRVTLRMRDSDQQDVFFVGMPVKEGKRHIRRAGHSEIYLMDLLNTDRYVTTKDWIKKDRLSLPSATIDSISSTDYTLNKTDKGWVLADQRKDETVDQRLVDAFVTSFSQLTVDQWVTGAVLDVLNRSNPVQTIVISGSVDNQAQKFVYDVYKTTEKTYLKRRDIENFYEISLRAASDFLKVRSQWLTTVDQARAG